MFIEMEQKALERGQGGGRTLSITDGAVGVAPDDAPDEEDEAGAGGSTGAGGSGFGKELAVKAKAPKGSCEHVAEGMVPFAHNMCRECFSMYLEISGGIQMVGLG